MSELDNNVDTGLIFETLEQLVEYLRQRHDVPVPEPLGSMPPSEENMPQALAETVAKLNELVAAMREQQKATLPDTPVDDDALADVLHAINRELDRLRTMSGTNGIEIVRSANSITISGPNIEKPLDIMDPATTHWGKCITNWVNDTHPGVPYVGVNPCDDRLGTAVATTVARTVFLPRGGDRYVEAVTGTAAHWETGWDPNLCTGDIIAYEQTNDGTYVCTSGYLQPKIGSVIMWVRSDTYGAVDATLYPPGWRPLDGSGTIDMRGAFPVGFHSATGVALERGASLYYKTIGEGSGWGIHGFHSTPGTMNGHPDHKDHAHALPGIQEVSSGTGICVTAKALGAQNTGAQLIWNGAGCYIAGALRHAGWFNAWTAQSPVPEAHDYFDTDNRPPYKTIVFLERYDNSTAA